MKKIFIIILLIVLTFSSCYWETTPRSYTGTGTITITIELEDLWWPNKLYMEGDIVFYDGLYESCKNDNINHKPPISPEWWKVLE